MTGSNYKRITPYIIPKYRRPFPYVCATAQSFKARVLRIIYALYDAFYPNCKIINWQQRQTALSYGKIG